MDNAEHLQAASSLQEAKKIGTTDWKHTPARAGSLSQGIPLLKGEASMAHLAFCTRHRDFTAFSHLYTTNISSLDLHSSPKILPAVTCYY